MWVLLSVLNHDELVKAVGDAVLDGGTDFIAKRVTATLTIRYDGATIELPCQIEKTEEI